MRLDASFDPLPLSPDLEWMLQSPQVKDADLLDKLVKTYGVAVWQVSSCILSDSIQQRQAVQGTFLTLLQQRHTFSNQGDLALWAAQNAIDQAWQQRRGWHWHTPKAFRMDQERTLPDIHFEAELRPLQLAARLYFRKWLETVRPDERLALLFRYHWDFSVDQIASLTRRKPACISAWLAQANDLFTFPEVGSGAPGDHLAELIKAYWAKAPFSAEELRQIAQDTIGLAGKRKVHQRWNIFFREWSFWSCVILLAAVVSAAASLVQPVPETTPQVVVVTSTSTPSQPILLAQAPVSPARQPLNMLSTPQEIVARVRRNFLTLSTIRLTANLYFKGVQGYQEAPIQQQIQIWEDRRQGRTIRTLIGEDGVPVEIVLMTQGRYYLGRLGDSGDMIFRELRGGDVARVDYLANLVLYPYSLLNFPTGQIRPIQEGLLLGRQALQVDNGRMPANRTISLWLDAKTGFALEQQVFNPDNPGEILLQVVVQEIAFNEEIPAGIFSTLFPWGNDFDQWVLVGMQSPAAVKAFAFEGSVFSPTIEYHAPPTGLDLAQSRLTFYFARRYDYVVPTSLHATLVAELFADGFFLGRIPLGYFWRATCARSPDGLRILVTDDPVDMNDLPAMKWLNLEDVSVQHRVMAGYQVTSAVFAPDGQRAAILTSSPPGIYLLNLDSGEVRLLLELADARSLVWSPEGHYLALIASFFIPGQDQQVIVLDTLSGEVTYRQAIDIASGPNRRNWPMQTWGVDFPVEIAIGLEGCYDPPPK